ncbi:unnamed protein product [Thlaspi arvense]|uniref:Uncharacterized protein n=1 Tax=Thlaspi arvense TaxID=13288 RepID=A0AAU9S1G9_THLAR|nr:unnamed protein product [Thlaspi arvense]
MAANACLRLPAAKAVRPEEGGVLNSKSTQEKPRLYLTKPSWIVTTQVRNQSKTPKIFYLQSSIC